MLVNILNNIPNGIITISNADKELEFLANNPTYIESDFNFIESLDLYEYDGTTFNLVADWEAIKATREAELLASMIPTPPTFEELQSQKLAEVRAKYEAIYEQALASYSEVEKATFADQKAEYRAYQLDNTAPTPTVDAIATGRGITRDELLTKIGNNIIGQLQLIGQQQAEEDMIKACTTIQELDGVAV